MIIELGHFAFALAMVLALIQSVVPLAGAALDKTGWMMLGRQSAISVAGTLTISFLALMHAYALSDFSVWNVVQNSHTMKPLLYKISGVWGNHEGSMLLWVWMLSLWGLALVRLGGKMPVAFLSRVLSVQGMVIFGFTLFIFLTSNPFLRVDPAPVEGMDLNPLLQDPALAAHPPLLYMGYVGFSVAFCFAVAALIEGRMDEDWARRLRPWVLAAWVALTCGIALGSFWAYYELGWGGFWFWDPVENAALLPWLAGTALLHSVIVLEKRGALRNWTVFLAIFAFSLSLLGTFLVRSGVLTSVHSFAVDPERGIFILALLGLATGGALLLYAFRAPVITLGRGFALFSRETALLLNNVFLFTFAATVFMGTLYPLFLSALGLGSVSVGAPYFNRVLLPLLLPFALLMGAAPVVAWHEGHVAASLKKMAIPAGLTLLVLAGMAAVSLPQNFVVLGGVGAAVWILLASLHDVLRKTRVLTRWRNLPAGWFAMIVAHAGIAVLILGVTAATQWKQEDIRWMGPGDEIIFAGKNITFLGADTDLGKNYNIDRGLLSLKGEDAMLLPEKRWYPAGQKMTSEVALRFYGASALYAVMGDQDVADSSRWVIRLYYHPLVALIFGGAAMIALGGFLALFSRRRGAA